MKYKELFDHANGQSDIVLKEKLRKYFKQWCEKNERTPMSCQSIEDFWNEEAPSIEEFISKRLTSDFSDNK